MNTTIWDKISRNALSNFAGTAVALAVGFFLMPFIIHRIGATAYGIWMLSTSLVGYMGLLDVGLALTLIKKSAEHLAREEKDELNKVVSTIFTMYLLIGALLGCAIFSLSFYLPQVFNIAPEDVNTFKTVLWIIGLQAALSFPMSIWSGLIQGLQDFHISNCIAVFNHLIRAIVTVLLLLSGFGLISLIWLGFVIAIVGWLATMSWIRRRIPYLRIKLSRLEWIKVKDLSRFSGVMFIWGIAGRTIHQADRIIIGMFLPIASITIYEVGARINQYSRSVLLYSVLSTIMPAASELNAKDEKATLQKLYLKGTKYLLVAYTAVVVALLLFGKEFIQLWMGERFEDSVWIMYALVIGSLYQTQNVTAHVMLQGMGKLRIFTRVMIAYPIVNIILSVIFVIYWGLIGVALATTLTFIILETYFIFYITKIFEIRPLSLLKECHLSAATSLIPAVAVAYGLKSILDVNSWATLFLGISSFLAAYFLSFWILVTSREERIYLKSKTLGMLNQLKMRTA